MPHLIVSAKAVRDLQRIRVHFEQFSKEAAQRAALLLMEATDMLSVHPLLGTPLEDMPDYRELIKPFGAGSFIIRYRLHDTTIVLVAIKHSREKALYML